MPHTGVLLGQYVGFQVEQWEHGVLCLGAIPTGRLPAWSTFMGEGACVWGSLGSSEQLLPPALCWRAWQACSNPHPRPHRGNRG